MSLGCVLTLALLLPGEANDDPPALPCESWATLAKLPSDFAECLSDFLVGDVGCEGFFYRMAARHPLIEGLDCLAIGDQPGVVLHLLGEPPSNYILGSKEYWLYPKCGVQITFDHNGKLVSVGLIPPKIPANLSEPTKCDMRHLQGPWATEEIMAGNMNLGRTGYVFDGDRLSIYGGGIVLTFCYRLDPVKKTLRLFLPDPEDAKNFPGPGFLDRDFIYHLEGDRLQLKFTKDGKEDRIELTRFATGSP